MCYRNFNITSYYISKKNTIFSGNINGAIAHVNKTKNDVSKQNRAYLTSNAKETRSKVGMIHVKEMIA
ncbi:MAG: hypothetical protein ACUZ8E_03980 [Candidatus Anammoxibacter sp.]